MIFRFRDELITGIILLACFISFGCGPNQRIMNSAAEKPPLSTDVSTNSKPMPSSFESDLESMRTADFNFIHVFRRKDGRELDADDKRFINANTPMEVNRRKLSDGGNALITGSNFRLPPESLKAMSERFSFQDFSKPESEILKSTEPNR